MEMNLGEVVHMVELHTMPQGHPDYRFICQEMWRKDSGSSSGASELRQVYRLEKISVGTITVRNADGV